MTCCELAKENKTWKEGFCSICQLNTYQCPKCGKVWYWSGGGEGYVQHLVHDEPLVMTTEEYREQQSGRRRR